MPSKLNDYFTALAAERRDNPRDDLLSALIEASDAGDGRLSGTELLDNLNTLLLAGLVTTTNLLGSGLQIVLQDPVIGTGIRDGSIPVGGFVEEVLRYDSPIQMAVRLAADHVQIGDVRVTPSTQIVLLLGAGNRDPRQFTYPDRFDPLRSERGPLSFGAGPHFCLGAALARLEASIGLLMLSERSGRWGAAEEDEQLSGSAITAAGRAPESMQLQSADLFAGRIGPLPEWLPECGSQGKSAPMPAVLIAGLIPGLGCKRAHPREHGMPGREFLACQPHRVVPSADVRVPGQP